VTRSQLRDLLASLEGQPEIGEPVDGLAHALQTAGFAIAEGADDELVLAAALHDIGRAPAVRRRYPSFPHEDAGAEFLAHYMSERVSWLVRAHVDAKRFLVSSEAYADILTARSTVTLIEQGGPMTAAEARSFLAHRWAADAISLRRWDDAGKVAGASTPDLEEVVGRYNA
jgi:gamma-butyrobetaine dioxygenase